MKFPISIAVVIAGSLCGCTVLTELSSGGASERIWASGPVTSKSYEVADFSSIEADSSFEIAYATGRSRSVSVQAEKSALNHIAVTSSNGVLRLRIEGSLSTNHPIKVKIVNPSLNSIRLQGAASGDFKLGSTHKFEAMLDGSSAAKLEGSLSELKAELNGASSLDLATRGNCVLTAQLDGSSALKSSATASILTASINGDSALSVEHLAAKAATARMDGSSSLRASGSADVIALIVNGASNADLGNVRVGLANVVAGGSSSVKLGETKSLTAHADGGSHVQYRGNAEVKKVVSDSASVTGE